ncbi:TetR/AcrR family transcriptional regulator [Alkalihalobacillus sp. AL-G]|uniref:TetR/AcrR family transcriptional regulator n=1 Tax=Alkalihalobacillus sp. AL-G TaxID=2926399 RepID=UPI0027295DC4|nr:TetR/AcrR family transcriptional regulator [Alkalihalobacillus sp. AL-G]WLD92570.1 TetR/AcrR family transcriptional regulator [Alkalihalobacillus sp. AL-G]
MNGFEQRSELKKSQIRQAALKLLSKLEPFTIKDIAKEAKVSQVSIYNYFGSKDSLLMDIMKNQMESTVAEYHTSLKRDIAFPDIIKSIMMNENLILNFMNTCLEEINEKEPFLKMVEEFQKEQLIPYFIELMEMGSNLGYIAPNLQTSDLLFYFSMYQREMHYLTKQKTNLQNKNEEASISEEKLVQLFFYGLIGKS